MLKYIVSILIGLLTIICLAQDAVITTIPEVTSKSETFDKTVFGKGIWERVEGVDTILYTVIISLIPNVIITKGYSNISLHFLIPKVKCMGMTIH